MVKFELIFIHRYFQLKVWLGKLENLTCIDRIPIRGH